MHHLSVVKRVAFVAMCMCLSHLTLFTVVSAAAQIQAQGRAWDALEAAIDGKVTTVMEQNNIPGMTVAVSKQGRLVLYKGYGVARIGSAELAQIDMNPAMRLRIGSNSKVLITGPAAFKMMAERGIDRHTKKVYGATGAFTGKFTSQVRQHIARFYPIQAMAIASDDKVYTWYVNGTRSVGTSADLDKHQAPQPFSMPPGKKVSDIIEIAISNNDRVHVWYNDRTRSVGTSLDLDKHVAVESGVTLARNADNTEKSIFQIVGIAIAKSNNHVYAWYDDGTYSSGDPLDFQTHFSGRTYSVNGSRHSIRAMGIAANDRVYTWSFAYATRLSSGKAQSGTSSNLRAYRAPYTYTYPSVGAANNVNDTNRWFGIDMKLQHLLIHESGYRNACNGNHTASMFNTTPDNLTYDQVHQCFLVSRNLRWRPDQRRKYSNHNFGVWTVLFPEMTGGTTYRDYAIHNYLKPLGLHAGPRPAVRPMTATWDSKDAWPHRIKNDTVSLMVHKDSKLGLAAGGWTASGGAMLKITNHLTDTYSIQELYEMGWGRAMRGSAAKLAHNGSIGGGGPRVVIFTDGYTSPSGLDLSDIHIAINVNVQKADPLGALSVEIAHAVPQSNISPTYNIWN